MGMMELRESAVRTVGTRYTDEQKETAYQLWAFVTSRNASETARILSQPEWQIDVPRETVAYWAREYNWAQRAADDVHKIAPDLRFQAFSELLFAGLDGAKYIRKVNAGEEPPDKYRITAAIAAVDRIGFSPVGKGVPTTDPPRLTEGLSVDDLAGLSPDDLMRRESEHRAKRPVQESVRR